MPHKVSINYLLTEVTSPIHYIKIWFLFSFFLHCNPIESHAPNRELVQQQLFFYCGPLVQCTSTMNIAKNHLLVYKGLYNGIQKTALYFYWVVATSRQLNHFMLQFTSLPIVAMEGLYSHCQIVWRWAALVRVKFICSHVVKQCNEFVISLSQHFTYKFKNYPV